MAYVAKGLKAIRATPSTSAARLMGAGPTLKLTATGNTFSDPAVPGEAWAEIVLPNDSTTGWIQIANGEFSEVPDDKPPPLDNETFVRGCLTVERELNADPSIDPWFVTADFLIARSLFETGMTAGGTDVTQPIGPFALKPAEWGEFLASGLHAAGQFMPGDRRFVLAQSFAAGHAMHAISKRFSEATTPTPPPEDGPRIPSYLDLFLAYLTDHQSSAKFTDPATDKTQKLSDFGLQAPVIAAIAQHSALAAIKGSSTIEQFVSKCDALLAQLLDAAFDKMKTLAGDELPKPQASGAIPWLPIAKAEQALPVSESVNAQRIKVYFQTIDFQGAVGNPPPAWCGAFVGHCIKTANGTLPKVPALAVSWKTWGGRSIPVGAPEIPVGSVVVLKPQAPGASGHVGFFLKFSDARHIVLLGGNQHDEVNETAFPVTEIAAIRLPAETIPVGASNSFDMTEAGVAPKFQRFGDLIVDRFSRAGFTTRHQLAAVLANAIAESGLNPDAEAQPPERSYGLFQCNLKGVGKGHTEAQLKDPEVNISLIIAEARRAKTFVAASTLEAAVDAFVRFVERPANTQGAINTRMAIAQKLL